MSRAVDNVGSQLSFLDAASTQPGEYLSSGTMDLYMYGLRSRVPDALVCHTNVYNTLRRPDFSREVRSLRMWLICDVKLSWYLLSSSLVQVAYTRSTARAG